MRIGLTGIVVDDQDQAEQFSTKVLGFQVKSSVPCGPNEGWLSVVSPEDPDGVQLVLHLADEPARAFQAAATAAAAAAVAEVEGNLFRQEGEYWTIVFDGSWCACAMPRACGTWRGCWPGTGVPRGRLGGGRSPGSAGGAPWVKGEGGEPELAVRPDLGDAGALLDATAKAAYRTRLAELRTELEEAEGFHDPERATKARHELDFLVAELARAVGLGGRDRRAAAHAERARLNVTRAIRAAVANLARDNPALGRHLAATIRTGRYCAYRPDPRAPITWERWPGPSAPGLNTGAPGLNAHLADEGSARRRSRGARSRAPGKRPPCGFASGSRAANRWLGPRRPRKRAAAFRRVAGAGQGGLRAGRGGALERRGCGRGWMTRRPRTEGTEVTSRPATAQHLRDLAAPSPGDPTHPGVTAGARACGSQVPRSSASLQGVQQERRCWYDAE